MGRRRRRKRKRTRGRRRGVRFQLKSEKGYLLISTLFFLMFSGLFAQSMIKISGNQIIQFRQITSAYQANSALNMAKELLEQELSQNEAPQSGSVRTSVGQVNIIRDDTDEEHVYTLTLTINSGAQYTETLTHSIPEPEEEIPPEEELEEQETEETETEDDLEKETEESKENEEPEETEDPEEDKEPEADPELEEPETELEENPEVVEPPNNDKAINDHS